MAIVILLNLFDDVTICNSFLSTVFKFYRPTVLFTDKPLLLSHTLSFIIYVQALPSRVHTERRFFMTESDLPEYFYKELTPDQQKELCDFIKVNFIKIKSFNEKQYSNSLHGRFHKFHVSNGSFKEAMRLCGFSVKDERELNWVFNISKRSPGLKIRSI